MSIGGGLISAVAAAGAFIVVGGAFGALALFGAARTASPDTGLDSYIPEGIRARAKLAGGERRNGREPLGTHTHSTSSVSHSEQEPVSR